MVVLRQHGAKEADAIVPADPEGKVDALYVSLSIHTMARPVHDKEPILRLDFLEINKLMAKGSLEEEKVTLGWELDTRRLKPSFQMISLEIGKGVLIIYLKKRSKRERNGLIRRRTESCCFYYTIGKTLLVQD
eukprot:2027617-Ditylum_brightwellii.AAC.1